MILLASFHSSWFWEIKLRPETCFWYLMEANLWEVVFEEGLFLLPFRLAQKVLTHSVSECREMAEGATPVVPSHELLEWAKQDKRRFLHAVYRVGNLDRTIKYVFRLGFIWCLSIGWVSVLPVSHSSFFPRFYTECLGMQLLRKRDVPEEKYSNAFLGFGPEESHFVVELTYSMFNSQFDI